MYDAVENPWLADKVGSVFLQGDSVALKVFMACVYKFLNWPGKTFNLQLNYISCANKVLYYIITQGAIKLL